MSLYLDYNATTPVDPRVVEAMMPYYSQYYGNPSSVHRMGQQCRSALDTARQQVAQLVNAHPTEVIFTSGGTEANNLAIRGIMAEASSGLIALSAIEHPSVLNAARAGLSKEWELCLLKPDQQGVVSVSAFEQELQRGTVPQLVSLMSANNETGVLQKVTDMGALLSDRPCLFHTDAVQSLGKVPVDFAALGADLMTLSAHKIYGPKGAGALIMKKGVALQALQHGGHQERGYRAGTENVAAIVGFGMAAELAHKELQPRAERTQNLRTHLEEALRSTFPGVVIFGEQAPRLSNTVFFAIPGIHGETLLMQLDEAGISVSSGSACESAQSDASHVLLAMGVDAKHAKAAIRVSMGRDTDQAQVDEFVRILDAKVRWLKSLV